MTEISDPIILEHQILWKDLTEEHQQALLEGVRTNNLEKLFGEKCDVELPSLFTIQFSASLVDSRHPANQMLQSRIFVRPKSTEVHTAPPSNV